MDQVKSVTSISSRQLPADTFNRQVVPRLLVSIRSWSEALQAIEGGADILDIKEPAQGPLGMADLTVIRQIAQQMSNGRVLCPLSLALGEVRDWVDCPDVPSLPDEVSYAKLGLSGLGDVNGWQKQWRTIRKTFDRRRGKSLRWIAVAYADRVASQSPGLQQVVDAAIQTECAGLLIDTYSKSAGNLFDGVSNAELRRTVDRCHSSGLLMAVAGRLNLESLQKLRDVGPDIIAIRSAACRDGLRHSAIDASLVAGFRGAMLADWVRPTKSTNE